MNYCEQDYFIDQKFDIESFNYDKVRLYIEGMEIFAETDNNCFFIFDYFKNNYFYLKSYNEYFTDYTTDIDNAFLYFNEKIHPEDVDYVYEIHQRVFSYVLSLDIKEKEGMKLFYNCRMRNKSGEYVMTDVSLKMIETDSKGNIWLVLFIIKKSKIDNYIIPFVENSIKEIRQFTLNKELLSKLKDQEKEIVFMMFGNITNCEIATYMDKSVNTIKSNIQKIYNKLNSSNRFEFQRKLLMR